MNILVLGGTAFVGRHIVERALTLGHQVSVFHRGQHGADLPGVEHILGDRDGGLDALGDRTWDWVIDTCGYVPRIVKQSCEALKDRTERYLFISTISVYADFKEPGITERSPLAELVDPTVEEINWETYGGLKVLCEAEVSATFGGKGLIVRPGMIVGPYDHTDRFTYWFRRASKGGKMISLCERDEPVQFIDGRDLAAFCIHLLSVEARGIYQATGPQFAMTWGDIFDEAAIQGKAQYEIVRPSLDWLKEHGVDSLPSQFAEEQDQPGVYRMDIKKAIEAGLMFLPLSATIADTLEWRKSMPEPLKVGLTAEKETELIQEYLKSEL
jgi:2'-hydroxyisoflavone reductase